MTLASSQLNFRNLALQLTVTDAVDGATRLLCDAQRFGLAIQSVHIDALDNGTASVQMSVSVQTHTDAAQLCSRFARHVAVLSVEAR